MPGGDDKKYNPQQGLNDLIGIGQPQEPVIPDAVSANPAPIPYKKESVIKPVEVNTQKAADNTVVPKHRTVQPHPLTPPDTKVDNQDVADIGKTLGEASHHIVKRYMRDKAIDSAAITQARSLYPGMPDESLKGYASDMATQLRQQADEQEAAQEKAHKEAQQKLVDSWDTPTFERLAGIDKYGDNTALIGGRATGGNKGDLLLGLMDLTNDPNPRNIMDAASAAVGYKSPMYMGDVKDANGQPTNDFKAKVIQLANGNPKYFKEAAKAIISGKVAQYDQQGSDLAEGGKDYMNLLHDNLPGVYHAVAGGVAGLKAATKTGATLGHFLMSGVASATGNEDLAMRDRQNYEDWTKSINAVPEASAHEGEASVKNMLSDPTAFLDGLLGETTRFVGTMEGVTPMTKLNPLNAVGEGIATVAPSFANKTYGVIQQAISKLEPSRIPFLLDNIATTSKMFLPSMYHDYYSQLRDRGYSQTQAESKAMQRAVVSTIGMSLADWNGGANAMNKVPGQILNGVEKDAALTFSGRMKELGENALAKFDPKQAAIGGLGMATSAFGDGLQDHFDDINSGKIDPNTPIDWGKVLSKSAESGAVGFLSMGLSHLINGHGVLPNTPQSSAIAQAASNPEAFSNAVAREVQKGRITEEQGNMLIGFVSRVKPSIDEGLQKGMVPEMAAKYGVETARLQETAQEIANVSATTKTTLLIDPITGNKTQKVFAPDENGQMTEEAGKKAQEQLNDLHSKAKASADALKQLTEGSRLRGRTVTGKELLSMTANFTPDGTLKTEQAMRILGEGPFHSATDDITQHIQDPEVARYVLMLQNKGEAIAYSDAKNELLQQKADIEDTLTEKKDALTGNVVRAKSSPSEEQAKELAEINEQINSLDKKYPAFAQDNGGKIPFDNGKEITTFDPKNANAPIIGADGKIIDGKKRIAYALVNGAKEMDVVRPRSMSEIAQHSEEERQSVLGSDTPITVGLDDQSKEAVLRAREAHDAALQEPTPEQKSVGLSTPAAVANDAAAAVLKETVPTEKVAELLPNVVGGHMSPAEAEAYANHTLGLRNEAPQAIEDVPQETPKVELPETKEVIPEALMDKETGKMYADLTPEEIHDGYVNGVTPERYRAEEQKTPEAEKPQTVDHTTSTGNRVFVDNGKLRVVNKKGEDVSDKTYRKSVIEAAGQHAFAEGQSAPTPAENLSGVREIDQHIAEHSTIPSELAAIWLHSDREGLMLSPQEEAIKDFGITTTTESFDRFGDKNYRTQSIAKSYLRDGVDKKAGQPLDTLADEITEHTGIKVTPQDLVDFMVRFPNGEQDAAKTTLSKEAEIAAKRFEELTGFPLNEKSSTTKKIAEIALAQSEAKYAADEQAELQRILDHEYSSREQEQRDYEQAVRDGVINPAGEAGDVRNGTNEGTGEGSEAGSIDGSIQRTSPDFNPTESPTRGDTEHGSGEQAQTLDERVRRGVANVLVPTETLRKVGWSGAGVRAFSERIRKAFGKDATVVVVDNAQAKEFIGVKENPDAWYDNGTIYLNIEHPSFKPSSALHETGHLWAAWAKAKAKEIHARGMELAKDSEAYKYMEALHDNVAVTPNMTADEAARWKRYVDAYSDRTDAKELYAEEVLAHTIQSEGRNLTGAHDQRTKVSKWLEGFWTAVKGSLGFRKMSTKTFANLSLQEFSRRVAEEIGSGRELTRKIKTEADIQKANEGDGVKDKAAEAVDPEIALLVEDAANRKRTKTDLDAIISRISASDLLAHILHTELGDQLLEAVKGTDAFAQKKGEEEHRAISALVDMMDNAASLSTHDKAIMGGLEKHRGSVKLTGKLGEAFDVVEKLIDNAAPDAGITAKDIAVTLADNAAKEARNKPKEPVYSLPDAPDEEDRNVFREAIRDAADKADLSTNPKAFTDEAFRIVINALDNDIISPKEAKDLLIKALSANTNEGVDKFLNHLDDLIKPQEQAPEESKAERPKDITGIKNEKVDEERAKRGLPPAMESASKEFGTTWSEADKVIEKNPTAADDLIKELKAKPRPLTDVENALLLHKQIEAQNEYNKANDRLNEAADKGDEDGVSDARIAAAKVLDTLQDIYDVGKKVGTENARGLNTRKMLAAEDFSLPAMMTQKRAAQGGKPLSPETQAEIAALHEKITATQKAFDDYVKKAEKTKTTKESKEAAKEKVADMVKNFRSRGGTRRAHTELKEERKSLLADLKSIVNKGKAKFSLPEEEVHQQNSIPPEAIPIIKELARNYIEDGVEDLDELTGSIHADVEEAIPGVTEREIRDTISDYGKTSKPSQDEIEAKLRELKAQGRLVSALEDAQGGTPPKRTGHQRDKPSDKVRDLIKKVMQAIKDAGIVVTDPEQQLKSALDAVKSRLKNSIADLQRQILTGERSPKKTGVAYDKEAEQLKQQRDALKAELEGIEGKRELSDEQRVKIATAAVERSILDLNRRIEERDITPQKGTKAPETPELKALKEQREKLREELQAIKDAMNPKRSPEEIALDTYKKRIAKSTADYEERLRNGDFAKRPRKETAYDNEALKLKAANERAKNEFKQGLEKDRLAKRTFVQKAQDALVKWSRAVKLSGLVTLAKLTSAAAERIIITPAEEGAGGLLSKIPGIKQIAEKSTEEGGFNVKAESKALTEGLMQGLDDAKKTVALERKGKWWQWGFKYGGKSDLEAVHGKQGHQPAELIELFGHLHGALKAPVKRVAFARSMEKQSAKLIAKGINPKDPMVQTQMMVTAYKAAERSIFMQDNAVANAWNRAMQSLEQPNKQGETPHKWLATIGRTLVPFVKIPTNIIGETFTYATGSITGGIKMAKVMIRGIDSCTPEQADIIMRHLKKGSLGVGLLLIGYFNPGNVGGLYVRGHKKDEDEVEEGGARVLGIDIPKVLLHNPLLECMQIGATVRKVQDKYVDEGKEGGFSHGVWTSVLGLTNEAPLMTVTKNVTQAVETPEHAAKFFNESVKGITDPALLQDIAKWSDKDEDGKLIKRYPKGTLETIETGLPGLRQNVPDKKQE